MNDPCDTCMYYEYDDEYECYVCGAGLDEDDMYRFMTGKTQECTFYKAGDEYQIVRHQM